MNLLKSYLKITFNTLVLYFTVLNVSFHEINSILGFIVMLTMAFQLVSGTMLSFSLITEPMLIPIVRDEEDIEDIYIDDFFWLHERGVDMLYLYSYFHLFRKLYIHAYDYEHENTWKSGVYSFLIFQGVVFFGLVLCCTHLSEITLTIAANILSTFFLFYGKFYWWIFTDKQLCADTLVRVAYLHYVLAFYLAYASFIHTIDMHFDWKNEASMDGIQTSIVWWDETFSNELSLFLDIVLFTAFVQWWIIMNPEALAYENFMWGDIGFMTDIRFYGVAPHWYFRPFMAWLIVCPHHKTGIFGIILYFLLLFFQPLLHGSNEQNEYYRRTLNFLKKKLKKESILVNNYVLPENSLYTQQTLYLFFCACLYTTSFLPYGRFYNRVYGNHGTLFSYMYIFSYLLFPVLRKPYTLESVKVSVFNIIMFFKK